MANDSYHNTRQTCSDCKSIFKRNDRVYQLECGCRICYQCENYLKTKNKPEFIHCNKIIDTNLVFLDNAFMKELKNINFLEQNTQNQSNNPQEEETDDSVLNESESIFLILNDLNDKLAKYLLRDEKVNEDVNKLKTKYEVKINEMEHLQRLSITKQITFEERLNNLESRSYDGNLIWKITNFKEKFEAAKSGRQTSFYSPIFYSSRYGYRMCARVYLNGDGLGRNTHMSLFFVILRGEYDELLDWPFKYKVTFVLLDQSEERKHYFDSFRPDPNSNSFKQPNTEMNIASGIPQFCPIEEIFSNKHGFIHNNTLFIQVYVDTSESQCNLFFNKKNFIL